MKSYIFPLTKVTPITCSLTILDATGGENPPYFPYTHGGGDPESQGR